MYVDILWLIIGLVILTIIVYRLGYYFGDLSGYQRYDDEIDAMEKKGQVVFPGRDNNRNT